MSFVLLLGWGTSGNRSPLVWEHRHKGKGVEGCSDAEPRLLIRLNAVLLPSLWCAQNCPRGQGMVGGECRLELPNYVVMVAKSLPPLRRMDKMATRQLR